MVNQFSIVLPDQMAQAIQSRVEKGDYATASEVIREAMRAWLQREKRLAELDAAIAQGIAQLDAGQFLDMDQFRKEMRARFSKEPA